MLTALRQRAPWLAMLAALWGVAVLAHVALVAGRLQTSNTILAWMSLGTKLVTILLVRRLVVR